jgi:hypothetical protein
MASALDRTPRAILIFWLPLALQWIMMALEGPFLAAVIARLADPTFNLAAYGVAFAFAILVEAPVIMLMSASTALVEDARSYRKLRAFARHLNLLSTGLLVLLLIPPVYDLVLRTGVGLPPEVADLVYGALWILLPWPAAIGHRRFLHGILIRSGRTRRVAYGTAIRLGGMAGTGLLLAGERRMQLSRTEYSLLELFLRNPRRVLTRSMIFDRVWGYDFGPGSNALGVYMGYLRRKTEAGGEPRLLHTVRGIGYILRDDEP